MKPPGLLRRRHLGEWLEAIEKTIYGDRTMDPTKSRMLEASAPPEETAQSPKILELSRYDAGVVKNRAAGEERIENFHGPGSTKIQFVRMPRRRLNRKARQELSLYDAGDVSNRGRTAEIQEN